jgi:hypothetical protein
LDFGGGDRGAWREFGRSGIVVLAMYGSQSAEGVWVMGNEEVRDSWEVREGGLGVYF